MRPPTPKGLGARERRFPGEDGRLRLPLAVDEDLFIAVERSFSAGSRLSIRLYLTHTAGATDVSAAAGDESDHGPPKSGSQRREETSNCAVDVADLGVVPGNRVLLRGPNNPMMAASWFAVDRILWSERRLTVREYAGTSGDPAAVGTSELAADAGRRDGHCHLRQRAAGHDAGPVLRRVHGTDHHAGDVAANDAAHARGK